MISFLFVTFWFCYKMFLRVLLLNYGIMQARADPFVLIVVGSMGSWTQLPNPKALCLDT